MISSARVSVGDLSRIVVGVDPAVTSGDDADETGIVVVGKGPHNPDTCRLERCPGHGYVLADYSLGKASPDVWAKQVIRAYDEFEADRVVAEGNQGGELVEQVLRTVRRGLPITRVHARHGKRTRAEPVAALCEQGRWHHIGPAIEFAQLEDQLTTWTPDSGESPDRLDAMVWAATDLGLAGGRQGDAFLEVWQKELKDRPDPVPEGLRGLPRLGEGEAVALRPGCKHLWEHWEKGDKCKRCGGDKPG